MPSSKNYLEYVLDLLRDVPGITHRKMMGEYLLYSEGVLFGGIYDNIFLLKNVPTARSAFPREHIPYEGAEPMLCVDAEEPERIAAVVAAMLPQLPQAKKS